MMAELEANREARERQESHIAELTMAVTSLMSQVKGKRSNPTPEQSAGATEEGGASATIILGAWCAHYVWRT